MQLSEICFGVCGTLKKAIGGRSTDELDKLEKTAMGEFERCVKYPSQLPFTSPSDPRTMREIERTLRKGESVPHVAYDKPKIESHVLEIQQALCTLNGLSSLPGEDPLGEYTPHSTPAGPRDVAAVSASEKGKFLPAFTTLIRILITPVLLNGNTTAWKRLITRAFATDELLSLIETVLSSGDGDELICRLPQDDAQTLVDAIDEARSAFACPRNLLMTPTCPVG